MFRTYSYNFEELKPSKEMLLEYLKVSTLDEMAHINGIIDLIYMNLSTHKNIKGGYKIIDVVKAAPKEGYIDIAGGTLLAGRQICGYLKESTKVALFLCTAGSIFTEQTHLYQQQGDFLEAYIVDAIGSITVEKAMDDIQSHLSNEMKLQGFNISNRYSPGYCNWALTSQNELFRIIGDDNNLGITLSESCLMQPIKSISGIIGIGTNIKKRAYSCSICKNEECIYRKIKKQ